MLRHLWRSFNQVKNPKKESLRCGNLDTCLSREFLRLSIPVTAERLCKLTTGVPVLPRGEPSPVAPAVLKQKNLPVGFTNPGHFPYRHKQDLEEVQPLRLEMAESKRFSGKRESLCISQYERNVNR